MASEAAIQARVMLTMSAPGSPCRLFRNNVGVLRDQRGVPIRYGLLPGSADLIGWAPGLFVSLEIKAARTKTKDDQIAWATMVKKGGHWAGILRGMSLDDATDKSNRALEFIRTGTTDWDGWPYIP